MPQTLMLRERRRPTGWLDRVDDAIRSFTSAPISIKEQALVDRLFGDGYHTTAGVTVTEQNAFTFSAVYDAVNQSSGDIGKLPLNLLKRRQGGGSEPFDSSKLYWILKNEANPDMSAFEFRRTLQAHALTCKGGFAEIERDGMGKPMALWPLAPDRVQPFLDKMTTTTGRYRTQLRYRIDGGSTVIDAKDMIHIRGLGYDGYCAYPVIDKARQAIGTALAMQQFAGAFFGNNSNFGGILTATDQDLDEDQAKEIQQRIERAGKGAQRAWSLLVLGAGFKYARTGITPQEAQMDALADRQVEEVARFFNFPVHKLKNLSRATFSNIEQQDLEYYKGHLLTWVTCWEQELNRKLIAPLEQGIQYIKHNANAFLRGDTVARSQFYNAMIDRGVMNSDEVRDLEDMNPQPNGQGAIYLVQGAMVPKDKIGAIADSLIAKNEAPKAPPQVPAPAPDPNADPNAARKLEAAEAALREAEALLTQEREKRAAAEASGAVSAAEGALLKASEAQMAAVVAQLTGTVEQMRADVTAAQSRAADVERERGEALLAAAAAEQARSDAEQAMRALEGQVAETTREIEAQDAEIMAAQDSLAAAEARAAEASAEAQTIGTDRDTLLAREQAALAAVESARLDLELVRQDRGECEDRLEEEQRRGAALKAEYESALAVEAQARAAAQSAQMAAEQATAEVRGELSVVLTRAEAAEAELSAIVTDRDAKAEAVLESSRQLEQKDAELASVQALLTAQAAQTVEERTAQADARAALQTAAAALERERDAAKGETERAQQTLAEAQARVASMESEIRAVRQADAGAMAGVIAAHRDLVADIMRRMIERETDHLRRVQQSPEKLQRWLDTFYEGHADLMRRALLPAMRVHLAFVRSEDDPADATRRCVDDHVRESQRQIRQMLDGDADLLAASVPGLLYRWDQERPTALASRLMQKELEYARSL